MSSNRFGKYSAYFTGMMSFIILMFLQVMIWTAHPELFFLTILPGSIGNTGRGAWFAANLDVLFQDNGPLGAFTPIRHQMLQRHFGVAQRQARTYYTQQLQASNRALVRRRSLLGLEASFGFLTFWRAIHQHLLRQLSWQPTGVLL
jgi:hypothetical protein